MRILIERYSDETSFPIRTAARPLFAIQKRYKDRTPLELLDQMTITGCVWNCTTPFQTDAQTSKTEGCRELLCLAYRMRKDGGRDGNENLQNCKKIRWSQSRGFGFMRHLEQVLKALYSLLKFTGSYQ